MIQDRTCIDAYTEFLESKRITAKPVGFDVPESEINPMLFPFQRDIVRWALRRGRSAMFEDCGLGKTPQQLEWARHVCERTGGNVLILTPLAVAAQTKREGEKFCIPTTVCREAKDVRPGINITNYDRLHLFASDAFSGIVLDESSILKSFDGSVRKHIIDFSREVYYRLACTATPAPNDLIELTNHAEFLDVMNGKEIIALFFTQDGNTTHAWRLKGHAEEDFWRWLASWSVAIRKPSDLGHDDAQFVLPALTVHHVTVDPDVVPADRLFAVTATSLGEVRQAQRDSLQDRVRACAEMVNASDEPWIVWCNLNIESEALTRAIPGAVEVRGSDDADKKEAALIGFSEGAYRVLITKPSIAGWGMNWQHCRNVAFVGLSYSYEQYYQAVRRCWRFGQTRPVNCHIIASVNEGAVVATIERKERQATRMFDNIARHMQGLQLDRQERNEMTYSEEVQSGKNWTLYLGDSVRVLPELETDSVGLSVFSPPFPGMYAYTNSAHDMGNVSSLEGMIEQFRFLIPELLRVTMPGRSCCLHLTQAVAFKGTDGYIGIKDFRGAVIRAMEFEGWIYYGEVCIDKDPQVKAIRTKDAGLLFKSLSSDSARMHMALADYLLQFRKPGENPVPIRAGSSARYKTHGWITPEEWIEWAAPVWYRHGRGVPGGIKETDVLNVRTAREASDEKHLCPLQLGVIERAVKLWSAPSDLVLDPFNGVGSTGVVALQLDRRYVGIELKKSYFDTAVGYLSDADAQGRGLFQQEVP